VACIPPESDEAAAAMAAPKPKPPTPLVIPVKIGICFTKKSSKIDIITSY
jgi:hypothetical protein